MEQTEDNYDMQQGMYGASIVHVDARVYNLDIT